MDLFGIGNAMKSMAITYFQTSRATGRTTAMVEGLKDGDRVVFMTWVEATRVKRLCEERGVTIDCIVISPDQVERLFERGISIGRTIFDHSWVEKYYINALNQVSLDIDHIQKVSSGVGEAHRETRRRAASVNKPFNL